MIKMDHLEKSFGSRTILHNISGSVGPGETVGLVGLNGAGKTTLIRTILGFYAPTEGQVLLKGQNPYRAHSSLLRSLGVVRESDGFNANLTFWQNLKFYGKIKGLSRDEIECYAELEWPHLLQSVPVKKFSKGQRMQCALARAFMGSPDLFVLDEPTSGLDHESYDHFCTLVQRHQARGAAFLISSHRLETIEKLCNKVLFIQEGVAHEIDMRKTAGYYTIQCDSPEKAIRLLEKSYGPITFEHNLVGLQVPSQEVVSEVVALLVRENVAIYEVVSKSHLEQFMKSELA